MKKIMIAIITLAIFGCKQKEQQKTKEEGAKKELKKESQIEDTWVTLFDGNSFKGWHFYNDGEIKEPWKIEEGAMVFYPPKDRNGESYDIMTDKSYTNFVLSLEWKISKNGNSGVFWGIHEDVKYKAYETGPEIQVLDNDGHPDAKNGTSHRAGALYDMVSPSKDATKSVGEWNTYVITVNHKTNQGSAVLNGEKVVEFPVHGEVWDAMIAKSKFADWEGFGTYQSGKIGLQDHGDVVAYRNIKIKEL